MKKKGEIIILLFIILLVNMAFVSAEFTAQEEQEKVSAAYDCLKEEIEIIDCTRMTPEQAIFSLLAVDQCLSRVSEESLNSECWPKSNCDLKTTSQAILALDQVQENTELAETWLLAQNMIPKNLDWFLEVDSLEVTDCSTTYGTKTFNFRITEDKKIIESSGEGTNCLSVSENGYWIKIDDSCYDQTFETTCDKDFLTTLIFKKTNAPTIYVLKSTNSQSAGGLTSEQINSLCFSKSGVTCNYEGSLWASLVLNGKGYDVDSYMPYLIGEAVDYPEYSPEAFLYYLTNEIDYRTQIFENQILDKYWQNGATNNKYYDTALELYPFQGETGISEKTSTKDWLFEVQEPDGCWDGGNLINNAFILHSIWPEYSGNDGSTSCALAGYTCSSSCDANNTMSQYGCTGGDVCCDDGFHSGGDDDDCEESGFFCVSAMNCENILYEYDCDGLYLCCEDDYEEKTCSEWSGEICSSNEYCKSGEVLYTPDLGYGEECCLEGVCDTIIPDAGNGCEDNYGICEPNNCDSGYESTSLYSCSLGETCCLRSSVTPDLKKSSNWWIWVLFILIALALVGILFRDKVKMILLKLKSGKTRGGAPAQRRRPGFPPAMPPSRQAPPRRMISPRHAPRQRRPEMKKPGELGDVLKKLKDMSK